MVVVFRGLGLEQNIEETWHHFEIDLLLFSQQFSHRHHIFTQLVTPQKINPFVLRSDFVLRHVQHADIFGQSVDVVICGAKSLAIKKASALLFAQLLMLGNSLLLCIAFQLKSLVS